MHCALFIVQIIHIEGEQQTRFFWERKAVFGGGGQTKHQKKNKENSREAPQCVLVDYHWYCRVLGRA